MSATDELRRLLDERGVEYETDDRNGLRETIWCGTAAFQLSPTAKMTMIVTPKQAIAATLGSGTCRVVARHEARNRYEIGREKVDLSCGHVAERHANFCPTCGLEVVGE